MSQRDIAAALGVSLGELSRWVALGAIPRDVFEERLREGFSGGPMPTTGSVLRGAPVPARGRVDRVLATIRHMTPEERAELLARLPEVAP
jgi:hypothetical protein